MHQTRQPAPCSDSTICRSGQPNVKETTSRPAAGHQLELHFPFVVRPLRLSWLYAVALSLESHSLPVCVDRRGVDLLADWIEEVDPSGRGVSV